MNIKPHTKTILFCTLFNLFFEYSLRGLNELLTKPLLFCILTIIYLTLFTMLEDLITRYRFEDKHVFLFACSYGTLYFIISSTIYLINPWFFGVNIGILLFVNIVWWAFYQTLFPLYLSQRIFSRDWNHKCQTKINWTIILGLHIFANFFIILSPATGIGTPIGYITTFLISFIFAFILLRSLKKRKLEESRGKNYTQQETANPIEKQIENYTTIKIFDILGIISIGLMGFCAIFLTFDPIQAGSSRVNATALLIINSWTIFVMFVEIIVWMKRKKIPI